MMALATSTPDDTSNTDVRNATLTETAAGLVSSTHAPLKVKGGAERLLQLDVLRGLAIFLVLMAHQVYEPKEPGLFHDFTRCLHLGGVSGVDLFFVLSGFLVGGLLLRESRLTGKINVQRFLVRRGFKIWPAYYVFLLVSFIQFMRHDPLKVSDPKIYLPFVFNLQNYIGPFDLITHTWSLAVEEHFYLMLPIFLWALLQIKKHSVKKYAMPAAISQSPAVCNCIRLFNCSQHPFEMTDGFATHIRVDALFWGVLISWAYQNQRQFIERLGRQKAILIASGCALVSFKFFLERENWFVYSLGFTALYVGYSCILVAFLTMENSNWLTKVVHSWPAKALAFMGLYSYSIYLWHFEFAGPFVMAKVIPHLPFLSENLKWTVGMSAYVVFATIFGVIAARLIEVPVLAIRERFFPASI